MKRMFGQKSGSTTTWKTNTCLWLCKFLTGSYLLVLATKPDFPKNKLPHFRPFYHVYGQSLVLYGLIAGMTSIVMRAFEPELFCASIEKYRIRMLKSVPPMVLFLAKSPLVDKYDLSSVILISSGAAPLGSDLCEEVQKRLPNVKYVVQGRQLLS